VTRPDRRRLPAHARGPREIPIWIPFSALAVVLLAGAAVRGSLVICFVAGYALMSAVTYIAYSLDKSAAQHGRFRTQEAALHVLEVAGGWPGALTAQRRLRHKTKKRSYQVAFWAIVLVNLGALLAFMWRW